MQIRKNIKFSIFLDIIEANFVKRLSPIFT